MVVLVDGDAHGVPDGPGYPGRDARVVVVVGRDGPAEGHDAVLGQVVGVGAAEVAVEVGMLGGLEAGRREAAAAPPAMG